MGDRANVVVRSGDEEVFLYTHWNGHKLPAVLRSALIRGEDRWEDNQYLARIIFCEMTKDDPMGLTGYGITSKVYDGDRALLIVDVEEQTVMAGEHMYTFREYVESDKGWT